MIRLTVHQRRAMRGLWLLVGGIVLLGIAGQVVQTQVSHGQVRRIARLVSLDNEWNLASWMSVMLLLAGALLPALIARHARDRGESFVWHWRILAIGFVYLALDEGIGIHELWARPMQATFETSGVLQFAWVIPAAIAVGIVILLYLPFLRHLASSLRWRLVVAGGLYVGGAIGMELVGGAAISEVGSDALTYQMVAAVEEVMEITGVMLYLDALSRELAARVPRVEIDIAA